MAVLLSAMGVKYQRSVEKGIFACLDRLSMNGKNKSLPDCPFFPSLNTGLVPSKSKGEGDISNTLADSSRTRSPAHATPLVLLAAAAWAGIVASGLTNKRFGVGCAHN